MYVKHRIPLDPTFDKISAYGVVYCLHNTRNDKRYFGIAKTGRIRTRLNQHQGSQARSNENPHLFAALSQDQKHFTHTIVDSANSQEELFEKEKQYIAQYKTADDRFGYNMTIGGDGGSLYFRPFEEARGHMRSLKLSSTVEFYPWSASDKRPKDIPSNPNVTYKGLGWVSWKDYLGVGRKPRTEPWMPYDLARRMVVILGFNLKEYQAWTKNSGCFDLPFNPERAYKNKGWRGWKHYLGTLTLSELMYARHRIPGYTKWAARGIQPNL